MNTTLIWFKISKSKERRRSHKSFYPSSFFHKNYVQSFAQQCKDFHYIIQVYIQNTLKTQS